MERTIALQQYINERPARVVNLHLWPGRQGELAWYEDDGISLEYRSGVFHERRIWFETDRSPSRLFFEPAQGSLESRTDRWRVILRNAQSRVEAKSDAKRLQVLYHRQAGACAFEIENRPEGFEVQWR